MERIQTASASASAFLLLIDCKTPTMLSIMKGCGRAVVSEGACQKSRPVCCHRSPLPKICGTVPRFSLRDGILVPTFPKRS